MENSKTRVVQYNKAYKDIWDRFIMEESINGNFLHTRNFLEYHPESRFKDKSLIFFKGETIMAVIPANISQDGRILISHQGSTFGGVVVGKAFLKITDLDEIFNNLLEYLKNNKIIHSEFRMTSWLYTRGASPEILEYYLHNYGFLDRTELGYYINITTLPPEIERGFSVLRRRKLKRSLQNALMFKRLETDEGVSEFYNILCNNMRKFNTLPVHSLEELLEFKNNRLKNIVMFYGIYYNEQIVAGSMAFNFNEGEVFHTYYLASDQERLELCPNEFLYDSLIKEARRSKYHYLSWGTTTLEHGKILNRSLAQFKEGFGTETYVNRTYSLDISEDE